MIIICFGILTTSCFVPILAYDLCVNGLSAKHVCAMLFYLVCDVYFICCLHTEITNPIIEKYWRDDVHQMD